MNGNRTMLAVSFAVLLAAIAGQAAFAQEKGAPEPEQAPVKISAFVDKANPTTSDDVRLTIEVAATQGTTPHIPEFGAEIAGFRVVDMATEPVQQRDGKSIHRRTYTLRADLSGSYRIPPLEVPWTGADKSNGVVATSPIFIEVGTTLTDASDDIRDLKVLAEIPVPWTIYAWGAAAIAGLGLLLALIFWRRRKKQVPATKPVLPHEEAIAALRALDAQKLLERGEIKQFFFSLTEIFKRYIERRFNFNAAEMTTEELIPALLKLDHMDGQAKNLAIAFLNQADLVKFANQKSPVEALKVLAEQAYEVILRTKPEQVQGGDK